MTATKESSSCTSRSESISTMYTSVHAMLCASVCASVCDTAAIKRRPSATGPDLYNGDCSYKERIALQVPGVQRANLRHLIAKSEARCYKAQIAVDMQGLMSRNIQRLQSAARRGFRCRTAPGLSPRRRRQSSIASPLERPAPIQGLGEAASEEEQPREQASRAGNPPPPPPSPRSIKNSKARCWSPQSVDSIGHFGSFDAALEVACR
jgi:hypothetical protein